MNSNYDKEKIFALLSSSICQIKFEKVNGEIREMSCTLLENIIPNNTFQIAFDDHKQNVYDIENSGWRSFLWDSLKEVNGISVYEI